MATLTQTPAPLVAQSQAPLHLGYLDGLRALAALYVVLHHSWYEVWNRGVSEAPRWTDVLNYGHLAVDVFLVLSGFCLMLPVVRGNGVLQGGAGLFIKKRARRILPPYYAAIAFALLLDLLLIGHPTGGYWDVTLPFSWKSLAVHLLLLQNFSAAELHKINHVFWSISLEWWIYFLFPPLLLAWKRFGPGRTVLFAVAATYVICRVCGLVFHDIFSLHYIALFVFGMLGAEIACTKQPAIRNLQERLPWELLTWVMVGITAVAMTGRIRHFTSGDLVDLLVGLLTLCLLVTLSLRPANLVGRALSHRSVVLVGSFAYSLYLIHAPLVQILWQYVLRPLHLAPMPAFLLLELAGTPLIIAVAYGFHLAFERPFMSKPGTKIKTDTQAEVAAIVSPAP